MNPADISLVKESWAKVVPISEASGQLFYANLFEAQPSLRALFKGDMDQQASKLMQMISLAVSKLDEPSVLLPALEQLGKRHVGYGVAPKDYEVVGAALLKTLEQGLGSAFTPAVKAAWTTVYGVMAQAMTK
jgi:methyl-accepting chemotaxis protein